MKINLEQAVELFEQLPEEIKLEANHPRVMREVDRIEGMYGTRISPVIILVLTGVLQENEIGGYLMKEFELDEKKASFIEKAIIDNILKSLVLRIIMIDQNPNKKISLGNEKRLILKIFKEGLIDEFISFPVICEAINNRIFALLNENLDNRKDFEKALYSNKESFTTKVLHIEGKKVESNISNWIKSFVKEKGTSLFDNVIVADFVFNNESAKKLSEDEKKILSKILIMYRNIKFFPDSMPTDDGTDWEIIPIDDISEITKARTVGTPMTEGEKEIEKMEDEASHYKEGSLEALALKEEIEKEKKIEELKYMAKKFKEGSLEKKAIDEEIKRVEENG